ncbi:exodeoxyribonuclease III [Naasia sp. SYSU D00948]|uniref:exodeoxyribonuclease III n=1 Tax=Naasia sp. SYSU D00948 TaxID=2817379 RepID=UPI001B30499A|nr:exodeoxyribonuclease III [Naasia sp. SYSU D00948]
MRVATWNVNSIRARVDRVVDWLKREDVDVLAMQEVKCRADQFPVMAFTEAGYDVETNGTSQWNGVGFASRLPMEEVTNGFPSMPGFGAAGEDGVLAAEARAMGITVEGIRLWSLYVPNGREVGHAHYDYKLDWLAKLRSDTERWLAENPDQPLALMGDWNIAPLDTDVWNIHVFDGSTHVSPPERAAFAEFQRIGMTDVVRDLVPEGFTYWDYKQLRFPRNEGMRIDFILGSPAFAELVQGAAIHRNERKGTAPSDHVPVVVDIALPEELDADRPMIF